MVRTAVVRTAVVGTFGAYIVELLITLVVFRVWIELKLNVLTSEEYVGISYGLMYVELSTMM